MLAGAAKGGLPTVGAASTSCPRHSVSKVSDQDEKNDETYSASQ